ncbi:MAG: hypothetical protein FWD12_10070 [Alphaproteobacteria bacterium]|nr:hypothetical protein [Alphaproteobacteria bacterium]
MRAADRCHRHQLLFDQLDPIVLAQDAGLPHQVILAHIELAPYHPGVALEQARLALSIAAVPRFCSA